MQNGYIQPLLWMMLVLSISAIFYPRLSWPWSEAWKVRGDSEPSDAWVVLQRFNAIIATVVIGYILYSIWHPETSIFRQ